MAPLDPELSILVDGVLTAISGQGATLLVDELSETVQTGLIADVARVARRANLPVLGVPTHQESWCALVRALQTTPLLVCIDDAQGVAPHTLAALGWLAGHFRERPVAWLARFRSADRLGHGVAEAHGVMAAHARVHLVLGEATALAS